MTTQWWICTDQLKNGGEKKLGPFATKELALDVRNYVERAESGDQTYWVDSEDVSEPEQRPTAGTAISGDETDSADLT